MLKVIKQARTAFLLLNPDEVRRLAGRSISFGLVAMGGRDYADMEDFLIPAGVSRETRAELIQRVHRAGDVQAPDHVDLVLYQDGIAGPQGTYTFCAGAPGAPSGGAPGIGWPPGIGRIPPIGGWFAGMGSSFTSTNSTSKIKSDLGGMPGWSASGPGRPMAP